MLNELENRLRARARKAWQLHCETLHQETEIAFCSILDKDYLFIKRAGDRLITNNGEPVLGCSIRALLSRLFDRLIKEGSNNAENEEIQQFIAKVDSLQDQFTAATEGLLNDTTDPK